MINTLYKFKRLPFGLSCAPAIFQKLIEQLVGDIPGVACYLDDIVVTGKSEQEHLDNHHILDKQGIRPHPDKVKAIRAEEQGRAKILPWDGIIIVLF